MLFEIVMVFWNKLNSCQIIFYITLCFKLYFKPMAVAIYQQSIALTYLFSVSVKLIENAVIIGKTKQSNSKNNPAAILNVATY